MLVVGVVGSPNAGGRTRVAVDAVLGGAVAEGAEARVHELADTAVPEVVAAMGEADAVVFGSPTYRADITAQLKGLLDQTPRGAVYESGDPLRFGPIGIGAIEVTGSVQRRTPCDTHRVSHRAAWPPSRSSGSPP